MYYAKQKNENGNGSEPLSDGRSSAMRPVTLEVGREGLGRAAELGAAVAHSRPALALRVVAGGEQAHVLAEGVEQEALEAARQLVVLLPEGLTFEADAQLRLQHAQRAQGHTLLSQDAPQCRVQPLEIRGRQRAAVVSGPRHDDLWLVLIQSTAVED